jgi:phage tail sheath protein FI
MPVTPTYPGVYIQEIPSGVHTITGVATSIAAFVGYALQGPTLTAKHIFSFADFQRACGPIIPNSYLGYAVKHFFDNGGTEAYIVRIAPADAVPGKAEPGGLKVAANSPGQWSQYYGVTIKVRTDLPRFRLAVVQFPPDASGAPNTSATPNEVEAFENLSTDPNDARYVVEVLNDEQRGSQYVAMDPADPGTTTVQNADPTQLQGGADGTVSDKIDANANDPWFTTALKTVTTQEGGALYTIDLFNLLCVPGLTDTDTLLSLVKFCKDRRAFLIADCGRDAQRSQLEAGPGITGIDVVNYGALYFPWLKAPDPLSQNRITDFPPCGFVAGVCARTDGARGVWKAPAGIDAGVVGVVGPKVPLTDAQNGTLNPHAVNCIRSFPVYGTVVWGARTLEGDDQVGSDWKYVPVRRTALYIEESLYRGLKWVVFEPNDDPLWAQIRLNVGAFLQDLFRKGAFQGATPRDAYFVKCDKTTTTQNDINRGVVNVIVGFAPLKPAEFVILTIQQMAGNVQT